MKKFIGFYIFALFAILFTAPAFAASLLWDCSPETDVDNYTVYQCTPNPTCTVVRAPANILGTVPQTIAPGIPTFVIPPLFQGKLAVTAKDFTGNESGLSVALPFDTTTPSTPANLRIGP